MKGKRLVVCLAVLGLLLSRPAHLGRAQEIDTAAPAATYVVNSLADTDDGVCDAANCTLREAIYAARAAAGASTITFSVSGTITLGVDLPAIISAGGALTVDGAGQNVTISGNNAVRVFYLSSGASLALRNLTVAQGYSASGGGGIVSYGTLTIANCTFSGNSTTQTGGGISNGGTLTISNSTFSGNSATVRGGGIDNGDNGRLTITNSTFSNNSATDVNGSGGGIHNYGVVTIANSTFSGNTAGANNAGGGIRNVGTLTVTNSTFSSNSANAGGGIYNSSVLTVTNSTFAGNSAVSGGGICNTGTGAVDVVNSTLSGNSATGSGGGVQNYGGALTLRNTIVANSTAGGNCSGTITNGGNNIDDGATCGWGSSNGSMSNAAPLLGTLQDNGGATHTMALQAGSPAINGVTYNPPNGCPSTDQRGYFRSGACDIGAFEFGGIPPQQYVYLPLVVR